MPIKAIFPVGQTEITVNGLHQWDYGRELEIYSPELPSIVEVHFACVGMEEAIVRTASSTSGVATVRIPDLCLEQTSAISAWVFEINGTSGFTSKKITLPIEARPRPGVSDADIPPDVADKYTELMAAVNDAIADLSSGDIILRHATNADNATNADHATTADSATNADHATTAGSATNADYATTAGSATNAGHATTADSATNADHATTADSATNATSADNATVANVLKLQSTKYTTTNREITGVGLTASKAYAICIDIGNDHAVSYTCVLMCNGFMDGHHSSCADTKHNMYVVYWSHTRKIEVIRDDNTIDATLWIREL